MLGIITWMIPTDLTWRSSQQPLDSNGLENKPKFNNTESNRNIPSSKSDSTRTPKWLMSSKTTSYDWACCMALTDTSPSDRPTESWRLDFCLATHQRNDLCDIRAAYGKQLINGGFFSGTFRGIFLNAFHFVGATVHPLFYSRGTDYFTHFLVSSLFEALTFPLDTIKTVLQADVSYQYRSAFDVISKVPVQDN